MAINQPPTQQDTTDNNGKFPQVWIKWFISVFEESKNGFTGSFTNAGGDTVTIVNGKITDVS